MGIYVVLKTDHYDDPYEGRHWTFLDSVWSTLDKAQERLVHLKENWIKEKVHPEECAECSELCQSGHDCFYDDIDDADPNHIRCNEMRSVHTNFFIQERRIDVVDDEGE